MAIRDMLLPEFDQEMANTRKMLERVPEDRFGFQPHPKSWKLYRLAGHVADLPMWATHTMQVEVLEMEPGQYQPFEPATRKELLEQFDKHASEARTAIAEATDEQLNKIWNMKWEGKTVITMPRISVLRSVVLNHLIHHRAQLGVYLRLINVAVPGMYGPSADETPFGMERKGGIIPETLPHAAGSLLIASLAKGSRRECDVSLSLAIQSVAPRDRFEFDPDCVFDGNYGVRLEFKCGERRAKLVNRQRIVAVHQQMPTPLAHSHYEKLDLEIGWCLPVAEHFKDSLLSRLVFHRRALRAFKPADYVLHLFSSIADSLVTQDMPFAAD